MDNGIFDDVVPETHEIPEGVTVTDHTEEVNLSGIITMPRDYYDDIMERIAWLGALESAGVDNWDGIDFAKQIYDAFNCVEDPEEVKELEDVFTSD